VEAGQRAACDGEDECGDGDLPPTLQAVGLRLLECYCDDRAGGLRRLLAAETSQFPDLLDIIHARATDRVTEAMADRLARLTVAGKLDTPDPALAAEQFFALLTRAMERRTRLGTVRVPRTELRAMARAAVGTFPRAFAPSPPSSAPSAK
jgi:hypothetical protein